MKQVLPLIAFCILFVITSCQTRVVSQQKPIQSSSLELYQTYTIQTADARQYKAKILRQDSDKIYAKDKNGAELTINKADIREVKKLDLFSSVVIAVAAVAAVIFVPI